VRRGAGFGERYMIETRGLAALPPGKAQTAGK